MIIVVEKAPNQLFDGYIEKVPRAWIFEDFEKGYDILQGPSNCHMRQDSVLVNPELGIAFGTDGVSGVNGVNAAIMGRNSNNARTRPSFLPGETYSQSSYDSAGPAITNPGGFASYHLLKYIQDEIRFSDKTDLDAQEFLKKALDRFPDYLMGLFLQPENLSVFMKEDAWVDDYNHKELINHTTISFLTNFAGVWKYGDKVHVFSIGDATVDVKLYGQEEPVRVIGLHNELANTSDCLGQHFWKKKNPNVNLMNAGLFDREDLYAQDGNYQHLEIKSYDADAVESIEIQTDGARQIAKTLKELQANPNYGYDDATLIRINDPKKFFGCK